VSDSKRLEALQQAALAVSAARGERIFPELVASLCRILHCELALVGELDGDHVRTLGVHGATGYRENFAYPLATTPCGDVVGRSFMVFADGVAERYPHDEHLGRFGARGYAGYPLKDEAGRAIGVLAILSKSPLVNHELVESVMKMFAVRAEAELERRAHEQALAASADQYRAIFNAAADSLVLRDAAFRVVDVNPAYEAMSGRRREEALGRSDLTMSPPSLNDHVLALHQRALRGERVMFEAHARRKDGSRFHIETRGVPIRHRGEPHVLYIGRDITERRRAEQALRTSEEQYRAMFNAAADALVLRDADFRIVDVNPAYVAMSGYTREEVIGRDHVVANPPEVEARIRSLHARALAGETVMLETARVSKTGVRREVELRGVPIVHRGEPHVLYIGRDIAERKRAEQALRDSEEQYRSIFNAAADALVLRDDAGRIVDVNHAMCLISGYSREEVLNEKRWIFARPERHGLAAEMHRRVIAGETVHFEIQATRKDGSPIDIEMRAVPMIYRGRPHALGMARDITARKRADAERAALEEQLRQAQKMEAIGHLTGGIAHDFNNLLASIMGHIVLAIERNQERDAAGGDPKLARYLDQSLVSARRARDLIRQMLTFSRGQRGKPRALDLGDAVEESMKLLRGSLPSSVEMTTTLDLEATGVMMDPVQLDQVLLNLAINARDAMAGSGSLTVDVRSAKPMQSVCASCRQRFDGSFVELTVSDTGPGIAAPVLERMFEPFFTTKEVGRGSGMGLATVHGIVHEHGGHIVVDREMTRGASFRILLPALPSREMVPEAEKPAARARRREPLQGRILVVDDEAPVAEFMRELLESWGIQATAVTSPAAALQVFGESAYDVVITDQTMPGTTGFTLARELLERRPGLPVILCTGHLDAIAQRELESAGIRGLLHKPVEPDELYGMLKASLFSSRAA
jgi:PAS domain S-box-containing protein